MSVVKQLYNVTQELINLTNEKIDKESRENLINQITELIEKRDKLIQQMQPPYTEEESKMGKQIIEWNHEVTTSFINIKKLVQQDIVQLKRSKTSTNKYMNPYQNVSIDGMYYDKRK